MCKSSAWNPAAVFVLIFFFRLYSFVLECEYGCRDRIRLGRSTAYYPQTVPTKCWAVLGWQKMLLRAKFTTKVHVACCAALDGCCWRQLSQNAGSGHFDHSAALPKSNRAASKLEFQCSRTYPITPHRCLLQSYRLWSTSCHFRTPWRWRQRWQQTQFPKFTTKSHTQQQGGYLPTFQLPVH